MNEEKHAWLQDAEARIHFLHGCAVQGNFTLDDVKTVNRLMLTMPFGQHAPITELAGIWMDLGMVEDGDYNLPNLTQRLHDALAQVHALNNSLRVNDTAADFSHEGSEDIDDLPTDQAAQVWEPEHTFELPDLNKQPDQCTQEEQPLTEFEEPDEEPDIDEQIRAFEDEENRRARRRRWQMMIGLLILFIIVFAGGMFLGLQIGNSDAGTFETDTFDCTRSGRVIANGVTYQIEGARGKDGICVDESGDPVDPRCLTTIGRLFVQDTCPQVLPE